MCAFCAALGYACGLSAGVFGVSRSHELAPCRWRKRIRSIQILCFIVIISYGALHVLCPASCLLLTATYPIPIQSILSHWARRSHPIVRATCVPCACVTNDPLCTGP